jgi:hypothetical protein
VISVIIDANLNNLLDIDEPPATGPVVVSGGSWATAPISISGNTRFLVVANDPISGLPSSLVVHNVSYSVADTTPPSLSGVAFEPSVVNLANQSAVSFSLQGAETGTTADYSITSSNGGAAVTAANVAVTSADQQITGLNLSGLADGTLTLSLTLTDGSDNTSNPATTTTIQKDATAPAGYSASITPATIDKSNEAAVAIQLSNAEVGATYSYSISSSGGGTAVTGSGTVSTASALIGGINATALAEGTLTLTVTLTDSAGNSGDAKTATATKSYAAAPVITQGEAIAVSMSEDGAPNAFSLTLNATDANSSDTLSWSIKTAAAHGEASVSGAGNSKAISYTPDADFSGSDSFEVQVSDGALTDSIVVNVTVEAKNDAPTLAEENSWRVIGTAGFSAQETYTNRIAVSASGKIYVAHFSAGILSVKTWEQGQWLQLGESLAALGREESLSLALSPDAVPYVGYVGSNGTTVRRFNGSEWELVGSEGVNKDAKGVPKLIVDEDGIPYVAFVSSPVKTTIMKFTDGVWTLAGELNMSSSYFEFAVAKGIAYLAFGGNGEPVTVTAFENAEQYSLDQDGLNNYKVRTRSLATDADGKPYLAVLHIVEQRAEITLLTLNASEQWQPVGQSLEASNISPVQLVFAADNTPYLGVRGGVSAKVLRQRDGKMEQVGESAFSVGSSGSFSLALGADGTPYVAYQDRATNNKTTVQTYGIAELGSELYVSEDAKALQLLKSITLSDAEGDAITLTLSLSDTKAGTLSGTASGNATLTYNKDTGVLTLTGTVADVNASLASIVFSPAANYSGSFNFTLELSDGQAAISKVTTSVVVAKVNDAPVITGAPQTSVNEDEPYSFTPAATDVDGDKLTYGINIKPAWAEFDPNTGKLSGTPRNEHVGTTQNIGINVTDGAFTVYLRSFNLTVVNVNDAPSFAEIKDITLYENRDLTAELDLTNYLKDADGDELAVSVSDSINQLATSYSVAGMKLQMSFDGVKSGSVAVNLTATDGKGGSATTTFKLTVIAENDEPETTELSALKLQSMKSDVVRLKDYISDEESSFVSGSFKVSFSSAAIESGALKVTGPVDEAGIITVTSEKNAALTDNVQITVLDNSGKDPSNQVTLTLPVQVTAVNRTIELLSDCPLEQTTYLNTQYSLDLNTCFKHPDGGQLTFSYQITSERRAGDDWLKLNGSKLTGTTSASFVPYTVAVTATATGLSSASTTLGFKFLNKPAPELTAPAKIEVNATGANTQISERQLLGLAADASVDALNEAKRALVKSGTSVPVISKVNGKAYDGPSSLLLTSGAHSISWLVTGTEGEQSTEVQQEVWIWPQISVSAPTELEYGDGFDARFGLTGILPREQEATPIKKNLSELILAGSFLLADCAANRYLYDGTIVGVRPGNSTEFIARVKHEPGFMDNPPAEFTCTATVPDSYINKDPAASTAVVTIKVDTSVTDPLPVTEFVPTGTVTPGGTVVFSFDGTTFFPGEAVQITVTYSSLAGLPGLQPAVAGFNASELLSSDQPLNEVAESYAVTPIKNEDSYEVQLPDNLNPGIYRLALPFVDENGRSGQTNFLIKVLERLPVLDPNKDSDGDGLLDTEEGLTDSSGNGIADYLDSGLVRSQLALNLGDTAVIQCPPGTLCALGPYAMAAGGDGAEVTLSDLASDAGYYPVSRVMDFVVRQLPSVGSTAAVVVPLNQPVAVGAVYRKFANQQWSTFVENELNLLHSAPAQAAGDCPSPGSAAYRPGLNAGDYCIQLTLQDGGPNDADGMANGEIFDPGVLALQGNQLPEPQADVLTLKLNSSGEINLLANDTDPDGDTLELLDVRSEVAQVEFSADGVVQLTAPDNFVGTLYFSYRVQDSEGALAESTLEVTVSPNTLPVGVADTASTTNKVAITIDVLANDTDPDGDSLTLVSATAQQGYVQVQGNKLRYVPNDSFVGQDSISYTIADQWQAEAAGSLQVTVSAHSQESSDAKSGGAGIGGLMLGLLAVGAAWRRRSLLSAGPNLVV